MRNHFFKYDSNNKFFIIVIFITLLFIVGTFVFRDFNFMIIIGISLSVIGTIGAFVIYHTGVHINYKKKKIIIIDSLMRRVIPMSHIQFISLEEDLKIRKKRKLIFSPDSSYRAYWTDSSEFVYRNGKTFRIVFHMKDKSRLSSYYGWLYNEKSAEKVILQEDKIKLMIKEFSQYKQNNYLSS